MSYLKLCVEIIDINYEEKDIDIIEDAIKRKILDAPIKWEKWFQESNVKVEAIECSRHIQRR